MNSLAKMCLALVALLLASPVVAQVQSTGTITGRALDTSDAVIPGVEVTVTSPAMIGGARNAVTDENGSYRFTLLPTGVYRVSFALAGFKTLNIDSVNVAGGSTTTINGRMEVAAVAEEITVVSQAPTIDLESASVGVNWNTQKMDNLPYGRDLRGLAQMIPGMSVTTPDIGGTTLGGATGTSARTYGRGGGELVSIDGNQWGTIFGDWQTFDEVKISTAAKGAEAQNAGANINMVLKSGGNEFHGSIMGAWQDGKWQANNVTEKLLRKGFVPGNTKFTKYYDYNFELGGRIVRDKLWFYTAFSRQFAGQYIAGFISEKTGQQAEFYTQLDNPTLKLSYQITSKIKLEATAQGNRKWQPFREGSAFVPLEATQDQNAWTMNGPQLKLIYIISPKMTFEGGFARGGYWWPMLPHSTDIRRTDLTTNQTRGAFLHNYQRPIKWQYNSTWSWFTDIGGTNNEIKSGFLGTWDKRFTETSGYPNQQLYRHRSTAAEANAGNYFSRPDSVLVYDYPNFNSDITYYTSWYINDKVTVNRKLTLNAGLRFDRYSSALPEQGNPGTGPFATKNLYPERHDFPAYNRFVPRVSVVYDVRGDGRLALKASYGRYFSAGPTASTVNPAATIIRTYNNWNGSIPYVPVAANLASTTGGGGDRSLDPSLKGSWLDEYTAGFELGLSRDTLVRFNAVRKFDYGGSKVLDLARPFSAYTEVRYAVDPGRDNVAGTSDDRTMQVWSLAPTNPNRNRVWTRTVQVEGSEASDQYMAYEATFNKQHSNGWSFLAGYTVDYAKISNNNPLTPNDWYSTNANVRAIRPKEWNYGVKMSGQYDLPMGFMYSSVYHAVAGEYYGRQAQMRDALNTLVTLQVEAVANRYDWIKIWDNRISKTFKIGDRQSVEAMVDIFNTLNSSVVRSHVNVNGPNYLKPISPGGIDASAASAIVTARIFRLSARWRF
ncbi:MAG: TonB-dependent receptor [Acidobacteria bacterium]|nr:TonB-dependent receptor [Acidobacteriota bacterium]